MDNLNKTLMTFASYNAGPGRIKQLRREAEKQGLDPNVWIGNVERVASARIGRETVTYVSNIYKYYVAYKLVMANLERRARSEGAGWEGTVRTLAQASTNLRQAPPARVRAGDRRLRRAGDAGSRVRPDRQVGGRCRAAVFLGRDDRRQPRRSTAPGTSPCTWISPTRSRSWRARSRSTARRGRGGGASSATSTSSVCRPT